MLLGGFVQAQTSAWEELMAECRRMHNNISVPQCVCSVAKLLLQLRLPHSPCHSHVTLMSH